MDIKCAYTEIVDIDLITPNPLNPNKHNEKQINLLAKIIAHTGIRHPLIISKRSSFLNCGHGRLMAFKKNGYTKVPVDYQDFNNEADEYANMVADNKSAALAEHDDAFMIETIQLNDDLKEMDFDLLGMPDFELPTDVETRCKLGDLWQLGEHRLLCGDSVSTTDLDKLICGDKIDMLFTDPPYGINYSGRGANTKNKILNDNIDPTEFYNLMPQIKERYVWGRVENYKHLKLEPKDTIIWGKNNFGMGRGYRGQYECCFYYGSFNGSDSDLWLHKKDYNYIHPTQKPVELCERAIKNSNPNSVLDLFGGSGSTLIACEKTNRKCYMMELDPHYCSVILKRWEDYSGKTAKLLNPPEL